MNIKNQLTDESLIEMIKNGSESAAFILLNRYERYAGGMAKEFFQDYKDCGLTLDALWQEALIAYYISIKKFEVSKSKSFYPYWKKITTSRFYSLVREESYIGKAKIFAGISLDSENSEGVPYSSILGQPDPKMEIRTLTIEDIKKVRAKQSLPQVEKDIIKLVYDGYTPTKICKKLKISKRVYYYHKNKLRI